MSRDALIKGLWPDKALYGSVMLFVTALVGVVWALVEKAIGVEFGTRVPTLLHPYDDPLIPAALSLLAAALAFVALRRRQSAWAMAGALVGILGVGM
ncbi:MAG TPA: hypothetical protein VI997_02550, partial [Candidatus Thermoplasmatota archaeon]|nr:hypothetical protein [Candidatus Thermoplasmatota archaeon]